MRKIRIAVCTLFVFSCIIFTAYLFKERLVEDHTPPEIFFEEDRITASVTADDAELLQGVTAKDNRDGDLTDSVRISSMSHFIEKGRRTVTYIVFDKANQPASAQRTLVYTDYVSPRIYLKKPLRYTVNEAKSANILGNMTAEDCILGDLSGQIRMSISDAWYDQEPGEYSLTVQVSNGTGDICSIPMSVMITDRNDSDEAKKYYPMLSEYIVYTSADKPLVLKDYLIGVMRGSTEYLFEEEETGVLAEDIKISSDINYGVPGVYEVEYSYTSTEGIRAVTKLYAVVEE